MTQVDGKLSTFEVLRQKNKQTVPVSAATDTTKIQSSTAMAQTTVQKSVVTSNLTDSFVSEKRKNNGLVERLYNKIKNVTGLGTGTKKVEADIEKANKGEITQEQAQNTIQKYSSSQETSAQLLGDGASIVASGGLFFLGGKYLKMLSSVAKINNKEQFLEKINLNQNLLPKYLNKEIDSILATLKSNKKMTGLLIGLSAFAGGMAKYWTLKFDRIGSKEFKVDKSKYGDKKTRTSEQKAMLRQEKRKLNKARRKTNFKNFVSGMFNGIMLPVTSMAGIVGAPLFVIGNSLNRYFVANKTDKKKSFKGYVDNLKNDAITTGVAATAIAIPLAIKNHNVKIFDKNLKIATEKLTNVKLEMPDFKGKSALEELQSTLFNSKEISNITNSNIPVEEQIKKLTEENIFAVKFKQISNDGSNLTKALREDCPPSRTLDEAKEFIQANLGEDYTVSKLLGVGTVAETYLAKGADGKEVCVKMLKKGIDEAKIQRDKQKFIDLINNMSDKTPEEKKHLLANIEDLANGVSQEINLSNEMKAAQELVPYSKLANVVKPIEVKNGLYVMEKANGISLSSLVELNEAKMYRDMIQEGSMFVDVARPEYDSKLGRVLRDTTTKEEKIKALNEYIAKIEARTPEFGDINLSQSDAKYLMNEYMKVLTEQFYKVDKDGKVLHADIHPGNIFIDINAMRARKGKMFTLIDTGNVVKQSAEEAINSINLTSYINKGNVPDIVSYVLNGATLPQGMKQEEAIQKLSEELNKCFFDNKTELGRVTNESLLTMTSNIMQKYHIIPSNTQLNFNKAVQSADNSRKELFKALIMLKVKDIKNPLELTTFIAGVGKDTLVADKRYKAMQAVQEKFNLRQMTLAQRAKQLKNPNMKAENSEDYLTYKLKQWKFD